MKIKQLLNSAVIVSALGYFVDIYDLILFGVVRIQSLKDLGLSDVEITIQGEFLLNVQMIGMLLGGILWGVLGDKKGRIQILFGSILMYSIANIANGFVQDIPSYAFFRFIAGVGLAGELGAGITLVSEIIAKEHRGYATMLVATVGVSGAILAGFVAQWFDWRTAYFIGGGLGLLLLILRISVFESGMYEKVKQTAVSKGNFLSLFQTKERFFRYLNCIVIGIPIWYVIGILIVFSKEFAVALGIKEAIIPGTAIMLSYGGLVVGDFLSGFLSQLFKNRKKIISAFLILTLIFIIVYYSIYDASAQLFYSVCFLLGLATGYWAVFVSIAAEQFGTNLRATVTTTVPNFVRGSLSLVLILFSLSRSLFGILTGGIIVAIIVMTAAFISSYHLKETFGRDLDFLEE